MTGQPRQALEIDTPAAFLPLLAPARYKGAYGGRGSAKSHFFAELTVEEHICAKKDQVCIREVQKSLEFSCKKLIEHKIAALNAGAYFDIQDKRIKTKRGGVIIFEGMQDHTAESIKSLEDFDISWTEEAQALCQRSLDLLRPTLRKPGSQLWFSWNPKKPTDPVDALLRGPEPPPGTVVVEVSYEDNPWLPEELRLELEYDRRRDPDKFAHVWLGGYESHSEARVFKNWRVEEFDTPPGVHFRFGADWGFSVDPSVLVRAWFQGRRLYIDYEAYMVGCEIDQLPDLFDTVPESRRWFIRADSARPETISYMKRNGYPKIVSAEKGPGSLEEGVEFLKSFDIVVHPRCKHVIDELTLYRYKLDKITNDVLPILQDKKNNTIDAARYACEGEIKARKAKPKTDEEQRKPAPAAPRAVAGWMGV